MPKIVSTYAGRFMLKKANDRGGEKQALKRFGGAILVFQSMVAKTWGMTPMTD